MATGTIRIRQGKLQDLQQVEEFTQNTFGWGDYLPDVWARWVRTKRGELLVAELDKQVVGTLNVRYMEHHEAWLEGVRVRHAFRQRGVASLLVQAAHDRAARAKCRLIRLETGLRNTAAQHTFEKFGYRRVVRYADFEAKALSGTLDGVRRAKPADLKACWDIWQTSWMRAATRNLVPAPYGWRWWEQTRKRLNDEIGAERAWVADGAFMLLRTNEDDLGITLVAGNKRGAVRLLNAARILAYQANKQKMFWLAPHSAHARQWAAAANLELDDDDLLIYARPL